jgi:hypothetical protein
MIILNLLLQDDNEPGIVPSKLWNIYLNIFGCLQQHINKKYQIFGQTSGFCIMTVPFPTQHFWLCSICQDTNIIVIPSIKLI